MTPKPLATATWHSGVCRKDDAKFRSKFRGSASFIPKKRRENENSEPKKWASAFPTVSQAHRQGPGKGEGAPEVQKETGPQTAVLLHKPITCYMYIYIYIIYIYVYMYIYIYN